MAKLKGEMARGASESAVAGLITLASQDGAGEGGVGVFLSIDKSFSFAGLMPLGIGGSGVCGGLLEAGLGGKSI